MTTTPSTCLVLPTRAGRPRAYRPSPRRWLAGGPARATTPAALAVLAVLVAGQAVLPAQAQVVEGQRLLTPGPFDEIELRGTADVRLLQGAVDQVQAEGADELLRGLRLDLRGTRLTIQPSGGWKFWSPRRLVLVVTSRDLKRLSISGAADVVAPQAMVLDRLVVDISGAGLARFDHLQAEQLRFHVSGAGDGRFAGQVNDLQVQISGKSDFHGEHLQAQQARVGVSGLGHVRVWAERGLTVSVSGIGTVDYWGQPQVRPQTSGMATLTPRGPKPPPAP